MYTFNAVVQFIGHNHVGQALVMKVNSAIASGTGTVYGLYLNVMKAACLQFTVAKRPETRLERR